VILSMPVRYITDKSSGRWEGESATLTADKKIGKEKRGNSKEEKKNGVKSTFDP